MYVNYYSKTCSVSLWQLICRSFSSKRQEKRHYTGITRKSQTLKHFQVGEDNLSSKRTFKNIPFHDLHESLYSEILFFFLIPNFYQNDPLTFLLSPRILFLGHMLTYQGYHLLNIYHFFIQKQFSSYAINSELDK